LPQFPAGGLVLEAGGETGTDQMELGLLCGPARYADAAGGATGGGCSLPGEVGITGAG
jgi:hypothetical protein